MAIIRNRTQQQYTNVSNNIFRNQELSLRDRGLLTTLLSLPDNWEFSVAGLTRILKKDGKHTISAGLANLEKQGYLIRRQTKSENGKFSVCEWEVLEEPEVSVPLSDFQATDNPSSEKPTAENQTQSNTNIFTTKESIMNQSSEEEGYKDKWQYDCIAKKVSEKVVDAVFAELLLRTERHQITEKEFADICRQIQEYDKPIRNQKAFVKRCVDNYFSGKFVLNQKKKNAFHSYQQRDYDFEALERELLSN